MIQDEPAPRPGPGLVLSPEARAFWGYADVEGEIPPPPYQVIDVAFLIVGLRWQEETVAALLPKELMPVPGRTGVAYVFGSQRPGPISPYTACFLAIEIEGYDFPDGSHAYYIFTGHASGRGGAMYRRHINANFLEGGARWFQDGDTVWGFGGPPGADGMRIGVRPVASTEGEIAGIHNFLGPDPAGGGIHFYSVAFTGTARHASPVAVDILDGATERMKLMRPAELLFAMHAAGLTITYSVPRRISETAAITREHSRISLLEVFAHVGRPAAIVGRGANILYLNRQAEDVLGEHRGTLDLPRRDDRSALARLIEHAIARGAGAFDLSPIAVERGDGRALIVEALPVDPAVAGVEAALVLFSDPASPATGSPVRALQLLGLTPAEARLAAAIGAGVSPREAAGTLGITEHTARSSLKTIYDKLGINKQTELARIVTRLEAVGT